MIGPQNSNVGYYRQDLAGSGKNGLTTIYSTLEALRVGQSEYSDDSYERLEGKNDITIFATDLTILNDIYVPCGTITIICRNLTIPAPSTPGRPSVTIDVSGPTSHDYPYDGALQTNDPEDNKNGLDGNDVAATVNKVTNSPLLPEKVAQWALTQPGTTLKFGTQGETGGTITIMADCLTLDGPLKLVANGAAGYPGCNGQNGTGGAGTPGRAGAGGQGGDGGTITFGARDISGLSVEDGLITDLEGGADGPSGNPGYNYNPIPPLGGEGAPDPPPSNGGTLEQLVNQKARQAIGARIDDAFFYRLYQRLRLDYLLVDLDDKAQWIALGIFIKFVSEISAQYADASDSRPVAFQVYRAVNGLSNSYRNKYNVFGWAPDWVPSTPWETMLANFNANTGFWEDLDAQTQAMAARDAKDEAAKDALNAARADAAKQVASHKAKAAMYGDEFANLLPRLAQGHANFETARSALNDALTRLDTAVAEYFDCPTTATILDAAESVVFTMSEPADAAVMATVQIGKFINDGTRQIGGKDKEPFVDDIHDLRDQSSSFSDSVKNVGFHLGGRDGKTLVPNDGTRLYLGKIQSLETEIDGVKQQLGKDVTKPVIDALESMRSAILELGEARYMYNSFALHASQEGEAADDAEATLAKLDAKTDPESEFWHDSLAFMCGLYQSCVEHIAEDVALLQQKYRFITLDRDPPVKIEDDLSALLRPKDSPDPSEFKQWQAKVSQITDDLTLVQSAQDSALTPIPNDTTARSDLVISITDPDILKDFITSGTLVVMPTWYKDPNTNDPRKKSTPAYVANSPAYKEVRMTHIQPRVFGAKTVSNKLSINVVVSPVTVLLSHDGPNMVPHMYDNHFHRLASVVQDLSYPGNYEGNKDIATGFDGDLKDQFLDAVGLYAEYFMLTVAGSPNAGDDNYGLDRSGIHEVRIHFRCKARTGPPTAPTKPSTQIPATATGGSPTVKS